MGSIDTVPFTTLFGIAAITAAGAGCAIPDHSPESVEAAVEEDGARERLQERLRSLGCSTSISPEEVEIIEDGGTKLAIVLASCEERPGIATLEVVLNEQMEIVASGSRYALGSVTSPSVQTGALLQTDTRIYTTGDISDVTRHFEAAVGRPSTTPVYRLSDSRDPADDSPLLAQSLQACQDCFAMQVTFMERWEHICNNVDGRTDALAEGTRQICQAEEELWQSQEFTYWPGSDPDLTEDEYFVAWGVIGACISRSGGTYQFLGRGIDARRCGEYLYASCHYSHRSALPTGGGECLPPIARWSKEDTEGETQYECGFDDDLDVECERSGVYRHPDGTYRYHYLWARSGVFNTCSLGVSGEAPPDGSQRARARRVNFGRVNGKMLRAKLCIPNEPSFEEDPNCYFGC